MLGSIPDTKGISNEFLNKELVKKKRGGGGSNKKKAKTNKTKLE